MTETTTSADFIVDDCFADDDLLTSEEYNSEFIHIQTYYYITNLQIFVQLSRINN